MPASPGTQDDRAIECQKQIDFPMAEIGGLNHSLTEACNRVGKVYELINRWRAKDLMRLGYDPQTIRDLV